MDILVIEAPLPGSHVQGKTTIQTATILMGLPAVIEFMAYQLKVYEQHRVLLSSVRKHFIGKGGLQGDVAKPLVWRKCLALGWIQPDDTDLSHDRSDAIAVWSYAEAEFAPKLAQPVDDLFVKAAQRARVAAAKVESTTPQLMERF
ncbi:hypothetical protein GA830_10345 [Mesorhizobium sp. NBSH29]|nr:hypothetical protein GA830_10345 [Mesorhizobium sp. NBSH29]